MGYPRHPRPFPLAPLVERVGGGTMTEVVERLQCDRRQFYRYLHEGALTERQADHLAVRIGLHPSAIWPEWFAEENVG